MAKKKAAMDINIGIAEKDRKAIGDGLGKLLADSYSLFLMTHNFHWNVTGPQFNSLHTMFEGQYTELCEPGGARFLAFGVDADFAGCIDGLIELDLARMHVRKRQRYLAPSSQEQAA